MIREPAVSGQFYPDSPSKLKSMIDSFIDKDAEKEDIVGLLAPHAGYIYSGAVVGAVISKVQFKDTFVILGPNHTGYGKPFSIMTEGKWKTPLGEVEIDSELAKKMVSISAYLKEDIEAHEFEHSIEVQVPFLQYFRPDVKIVPIILSLGNGDIYKQIGRDIVQALSALKREAIIFASSDMSHYEPQGVAKKKDQLAIQAMINLDQDELLKRVEGENISMCGYAPAVVMLTAAKELGATSPRLVKYQTSGDVSGDYNAVVGYAGVILKRLSPLVQLAKDALETYIKSGKTFKPKEQTSEMKDRAGVFVCIKKFGELRGCIGTFEPCYENVAEEIIMNAISTAVRDPRFEPVRASELHDLDYTVDVLTKPELVSSQEELDPKKYGVIVECGYRRGLLLPDLEGVESVDYQIDICRQKGSIGPDEPVKLYRFEVKRYK